MSIVESPSTGDAPIDFPGSVDKTTKSMNALSDSAATFARLMTKAFADATTGGKQFDDVLKSLALRLSNLVLQQAFKPLTKDIAGALAKLLNGVLGIATGGSTSGAIMPFAAGGVIGTPSYFPFAGGGLGLAGEAGPEAIMPLTRGPDGRLGVGVAAPATPANVTVQIATPDIGGFRRSEAYVTGQIARAVARGQRNL